MDIRAASDSDLEDVLLIARAAFGRDEEAELVQKLLHDPTAEPTLSLLAFKNDRPVGHILFTTAHLAPTQQGAAIAILAPLAVIPEAQKQGIGGQLIETGLQHLSQLGIALVFVLGYPEYYSRYGFQPAAPLGFEAPHPIPPEHTDAWMVQALRPNAIGTLCGKVVCSDVLNQPKYWRE